MKIRWWAISILSTGLSLSACDCGGETVSDSDAGVPLYDGGRSDALAIDAIGLDLGGPDHSSPDVFHQDAQVDDAGGGGDASTNDDGGVGADVQASDAGGEDGAAPQDAATDPDATLQTDARPGLDTSSSADAATTGDASGGVDGGVAMDAGASADSATANDSGSDASTSSDASVLNRSPSIDSIVTADLLPGEQAGLSATVTDLDLPGDTITYSWALLSAPAGVSLQNANTATPTVVVDRAVYEGGPADLTVTVQLTVHDALNAQDQLSDSFVVLDERGPHIDNTSAYEGVDYASGSVRHGLCGVQAHPCSNIDDAQVNQAAAVAEGARTEDHLFVATTGSTYDRASKILLDRNLGLNCGYDPVSWTRQAGVSRTPIHFTSTYGVHVVSDAVTVEGCDIRGVSGHSPGVFAQRAAVFVESDQVVVRDNKLVGHQGNPADTAVAYGLMFNVAQATYDIDVDGNDITGGTLSQGGSTGSQAFGAQLLGGVPLFRHNSVRGGVADYVVGVNMAAALGGSGKRAVVENNDIEGGDGGDGTNHGASGVIVAAGDPQIRNNSRIVGGTSTVLNDGLWLASVDGRPTVSGNVITGVEVASSATIAIGVLLTQAADLSGNTLLGGEGAWAVGLLANGDFDNSGSSQAFDFTSDADTITGGVGSETSGLAIENDVTATLTGASVTASGSGASPLNARGATVGRQSHLRASASSFASGGAVASSFGIYAGARAITLTLTNCDVSSGNVAGFSSDGVSAALIVDDGALSIDGGSYNAGNATGSASISVGIGMDCQASMAVISGHRIANAQVGAGQASVSAGISLEYCADTVLENLTVSAGVASGLGSVALRGVATNISPIGGTYTGGLARVGSSYGMVFHASATATHLVANGSSATAGNAADNSIGVYFVDDVTGGALVGCTASGARASWSGGLAFSGAVTACDVDQNDLAGGAASNLSAGLYFDQGCDGCSISRNLITGGDASPGGISSGRSVGLRIRSRGATAKPSLIFSNRIAGGQASNARGVELSGAAGHKLRLLNNTIDGGGLAGNGSESYGVFMGQILPNSPGVQVVGVLVGNIIGPGVGGVSYNLYENSICSGFGNVRRAQPYGGVIIIRPPGGRNNNLFPEGATGYLENATGWNGASCTETVKTIGRLASGPSPAVNKIAPYAEDSFDSTNRTRGDDPGFINGYQLPSNSIMIGKSVTTSVYWSADRAMLDYDGDGRPYSSSEYDIGCDEWTP